MMSGTRGSRGPRPGENRSEQVEPLGPACKSAGSAARVVFHVVSARGRSHRRQIGGHEDNRELRSLKKLIIAAATVTALATGLMTVSAAAQATCNGEIVITEMNRASAAAAVTDVAPFPMEQGYGCGVEKFASSTTPSLAPVSGTGKPDIVTEPWINGNPAHDELPRSGTITTLTDVLLPAGVEGWWIPIYPAEEHPELAAMEVFPADPYLVGGRFNRCPEGWGCKNIDAGILREIDLEGHGYEGFQHGAGGTTATFIAAACENEEPWLGSYRGLTSVLGKYDMTQVDLGPNDEDAHKCDVDPDCNDMGMSSFAVGAVKTVVTTDFEKRHPDPAGLMTNVSFATDEINELLALREDKNASGEETTVAFLTNRSDGWQNRVNDAAREKVAAFIG